MDGTKCLMEELAMDTKKLAKLFPMIKPKPDSKSYSQMVDQQQQTETVDSSNAGQKRNRLTARHSEKEGDESMLNVPTPLCSIERGTQTSPRPLPPVAAASISAQATTKVIAAVPPPPPTPAARRTVAINTVRQQWGTVEEQNGPEDDDVINPTHGQNGNNQNRHHRRHYVNDDDEADEEQQRRQQRQRAKWRERVVEIVAQRQQQQSVPQQRHHFAKMGQQKWPMMPPKPTTKLTTMAQQQNERRKSHFSTKTRSFEERPSAPQPRMAWRHARSNQFVADEWAEMGQQPYSNYPQNIGIRTAGIRHPLPFPAPPPRRPRHAHLQRFFRSADVASSTSEAEEEEQPEQQNFGCGGCSNSSSSSSSSSTTMPTMEEGRRMGAVAAAPFLRDARNSSRRLYRSVDDECDDAYSFDYGERNRQRYGMRGMALIRGDQQQQQQHDVHQYQHQRRFLPDLPTTSRTMRTQMEEQQFPAPSSFPRPLHFNSTNNNNSTAWRYYRMPPTSRRGVAEPPPPSLARFNSLNRIAVAPLRRDFSVDRRTESLFRHFVRPDPFEIL